MLILRLLFDIDRVHDELHQVMNDLDWILSYIYLFRNEHVYLDPFKRIYILNKILF